MNDPITSKVHLRLEPDWWKMNSKIGHCSTNAHFAEVILSNNVNAGASDMVQWVKPLLATPRFHIGMFSCCSCSTSTPANRERVAEDAWRCRTCKQDLNEPRGTSSAGSGRSAWPFREWVSRQHNSLSKLFSPSLPFLSELWLQINTT